MHNTLRAKPVDPRYRRGCIRLVLPVLGILLSLGCRPRTADLIWMYPGHDPANTRFVSQPARRLSHDWQFSRVWEAEDFLPEPFVLNPVSEAVSRGLLVANLEPEPGNEIMLRLDGFSGILDRHGIMLREAEPGEQYLSVGEESDAQAMLVASSGRTAQLYSVASTPNAPRLTCRVALASSATEAWLVSVPKTRAGARRTSGSVLRLVTVEADRLQSAADGVPTGTTAIAGYALPLVDEEALGRTESAENVSAGSPLWRFETGASLCHIWAIADVNDDSEPELIVGTYGFEHGICANGIADTGTAYVLCFSTRGELLWRWSLSGYRHLYSQALVADLDADSVPEIVVACGSWDRQFGCLAVLDGRTGRIRAQFPAENPPGYAFTAIAAADLDRDGRREICAASSGKSARFWKLHFDPGAGRLDTVRSREFAAAISETFVNAGIVAATDLDGDRQTELVATLTHETQIDNDPYFYPSRISGSRIVLLDTGLAELKSIPLSSAPRAAAVACLGRPTVKGILVLTDRLEYYEPK